MSFDKWSDLVSGSLIWLGCADPCDTVADLAAADPMIELRTRVFQTMAIELPEMTIAGVKVSEIIRASTTNGILLTALVGIAGDREKKNLDAERLGKWLRNSKNKIGREYKPTCDPKRHGSVWHLMKV